MKKHRYTACGGVVVKGDRVLVLMRPARSEVRLPKGHVEAGESHEQAAFREVSEEAGYSELIAVGDLGEQMVEFDFEGRHFARTEHYFLMRLKDPEQRPSSKGELEFEPAWLSWTEATKKLTFRAEKEWVKRAREFINRQEHDKREVLRYTPRDLKDTAERILQMDPDPIPRYRLMRDVLALDPADQALQNARQSLRKSRWIALLESSQQADGTWGRFHTQNTKIKQPFPTTETAVAVALDSGLDSQSPVLQKATATILDYMEGKAVWPDRPEKHDNPSAWWVWVRHISAAVLALIDDRHPRLDEFWDVWAEAVKAAFHSGEYDRQREITALNSLLKCRMKNPIAFHRRYPLLILSATKNRLPSDLERTMLEHVIRSPTGIGYTFEKDISVFPSISSRHFWYWVSAHRLLSRFPLWKKVSVDALNWIWAQKTEEGYWDIGCRIGRKPYSCFPLSESWRRPADRIIDSTVEMLALLQKGCG